MSCRLARSRFRWTTFSETANAPILMDEVNDFDIETRTVYSHQQPMMVRGAPYDTVDCCWYLDLFVL